MINSLNITIKWQQKYKELAEATTETKREMLSRPVWNMFPMADILERGRNYALSLFSRSMWVVIKQGDLIISNSMEMRNLYKKKGFKVYDLASIQPEETALSKVGFI